MSLSNGTYNLTCIACMYCSLESNISLETFIAFHLNTTGSCLHYHSMS